MENSRRSTNRFEILVAIIIVAGTAALLAPVVLAQSDRNHLCAENARDVGVTVSQYAQDYDETLPIAAIWNQPARFQAEMERYTNASRIFRCPVTGAGYVNNASIAGMSLAALESETTEMLRDQRAHPGGKYTVAFLDGHIEQGGVEQYFPDADGECYNRVRQISAAIEIYATDYNDRTAFQQNDVAFRAVVQPYLGSKRFWTCPDTKTLYTIPLGFRGRTFNELGGDLDAVVVVRDAKIHRSGVTTFGTLGWYGEQRGPRGIKYPLPAVESKNRVTSLSLALLQYAQDYGGVFPPNTNSPAAIKPYLFPYVHRGLVFETPRGGKPFRLAAAIGGNSVSSYPSPETFVWIRDNNNYGDGLITEGFLDGRVLRVAP